MKIGQNSTASDNKTGEWIFLLISALVIGIVLGEWGLAEKSADALSRVSRMIQNINSNETLPTLTIDMRFSNYNDLLAQRQEALETGVYIPNAQDYVTATITMDNTVVPVTMRLYPGPANHLGEGEKWNFDLRTRQNSQLLEMSRFYLMDPEDNNWLGQWAFSRALEREGLLAARYQFVNLILNGDTWGVYALQEGFGDEIMTNRNKTTSVILEYDKEPLWRSIAHFGSVQAAQDPTTNLLASVFRYYEIDTFRDATIADDEARRAQKDKAVKQLRALQTGQLSTLDVFDLDKTSRFLALVDLWGANDAVELSNVRYYYDPETGLLEPIGFNGNPLDSGRLALPPPYNDPVLQTEYVRYLEQFSDPSYLDELRSELVPELDSLRRTLSTKTVEIPSIWQTLEERQELVRHSLDPVQPVFAVLGPASMSMTATIQIDVANVLNLPQEILGFDIDGLTFMQIDPGWIKDTGPGMEDVFIERDEKVILAGADPGLSTPIHYARFHLPITEIIRQDKEIDFMQPIKIKVATRILGLETTQLTLARE
ncbi:MAG: CotH kinase family protein [Anaerolineales bacterium]|nr:CotH kinase family protein [Anaerolineales bacterium]